MRKLLWLLGLFGLGLAAGAASAQTAAINGFCSSGGRTAVVSGLQSTNILQGVVPACTVTVYVSGTTTLATIYSDGSSTHLSNPFTASPLGSVAPGQWLFYAATANAYDVVMSGGISPNTYPAPVTLTGLGAGGGGGSGNCTGTVGYLAEFASPGCADSPIDFGVTSLNTVTLTTSSSQTQDSFDIGDGGTPDFSVLGEGALNGGDAYSRTFLSGDLIAFQLPAGFCVGSDGFANTSGCLTQGHDGGNLTLGANVDNAGNIIGPAWNAADVKLNTATSGASSVQIDVASTVNTSPTSVALFTPSGETILGSPVCTVANGLCPGGGSSLTLTTIGTSGAATLSGSTLNIPVYVAPSGQYLQLNPSSGTSQTVTSQPGTITTNTQTSVGNVATVTPNVLSMYSLGQGYDLGNNGTSAQGWSAQDLLTLNAYSATRGIMHGTTHYCDHDAMGDFDCDYFYSSPFGGGQAASDEFAWNTTIHQVQAPWFNGALVTPGIGIISPAFSTLASGNTYIWGGGGSGATTFQTAGNVQSFSVDFLTSATSQTGYIGTVTINGGGSYTLGAPVAVPVAAGTGIQTWTPSNFGTLPVTAGQSMYFYVGTGNGPAGTSINLIYVAGTPVAGTYIATTAGSGGVLMTASLTAPTTGANSVTVGSLTCNIGGDLNCVDPRLRNSFADGGIMLDTTATSPTATIGAQSIIMGGLSYALTAGTVTPSVAWGNIIPSSCTNNGNGQFQGLTATTCTITLGTSPASPNHFVVSGGNTTCSAVATSAGTSLDIHLSGPFAEEAYVIAVTTGSTTDSVTFCTRNAWDNAHGNTNAARVMQGGTGSSALVATSTVSSWPVAYPVDGAFTSTQLAFSDCIPSGCNGVSGAGNILPTGTPITIYSAGFITGTGNGAVNTATLGTNAIPFSLSDNLAGAPTAEFAGGAMRIVYGQWTPLDGSFGTGIITIADTGGVPALADFRLTTTGSSGSPAFSQLEGYGTGYWQYYLYEYNRPTTAMLYTIGDGSGSTYDIFGDNLGGGTFTFTPGTSFGLNKLLTVPSITATSAASAFAASTTIGGTQVCLASGTNCPSGAGIPTTPTNYLVKINGSNGAPSTFFDTGSATGTTLPFSAPSIGLGASPPTACGANAGCIAQSTYSAAGTPLPTCNSSTVDSMMTVSDATSPTYMGAYTSGGAITSAVICSYNGSAYGWKTH